eukprot:637880-Pyramimonas_sp.AAC.1
MIRRVRLLNREVRTRSASRARSANLFVIFEPSPQTLSVFCTYLKLQDSYKADAYRIQSSELCLLPELGPRNY